MMIMIISETKERIRLMMIMKMRTRALIIEKASTEKARNQRVDKLMKIWKFKSEPKRSKRNLRTNQKYECQSPSLKSKRSQHYPKDHQRSQSKKNLNQRLLLRRRLNDKRKKKQEMIKNKRSHKKKKNEKKRGQKRINLMKKSQEKKSQNSQQRI